MLLHFVAAHLLLRQFLPYLISFCGSGYVHTRRLFDHGLRERVHKQALVLTAWALWFEAWPRELSCQPKSASLMPDLWYIACSPSPAADLESVLALLLQ